MGAGVGAAAGAAESGDGAGASSFCPAVDGSGAGLEGESASGSSEREVEGDSVEGVAAGTSGSITAGAPRAGSTAPGFFACFSASMTLDRFKRKTGYKGWKSDAITLRSQRERVRGIQMFKIKAAEEAGRREGRFSSCSLRENTRCDDEKR